LKRILNSLSPLKGILAEKVRGALVIFPGCIGHRNPYCNSDRPHRNRHEKKADRQY